MANIYVVTDIHDVYSYLTSYVARPDHETNS